MNTYEELQNLESQAANPFPEPQTIPQGWDLSGLSPAPISSSVSDAESETDQEIAEE